jgi:O-antigen ligase
MWFLFILVLLNCSNQISLMSFLPISINPTVGSVIITISDMLLMITIIVGFLRIGFLKKVRLFYPTYLLFILLFLSSVFVSIINAKSQIVAVKEFIQCFFYIFGIYFVLCFLINDSKKERINKIYDIIIFTGIIATIAAIVQTVGAIIFNINIFQSIAPLSKEAVSELLGKGLRFRASGLYTHPGSLGIFCSFTFCLSLARLFGERKKLFGTMGLLFAIMGIILSFTRAALISVIIIGFFIPILMKGKIKRFFLTLFLLGIFLVIIWTFFPFISNISLENFIEQATIKDSLIKDRGTQIIMAWKIFKQNPFFGCGIGNFPIISKEIGYIEIDPHNFILKLLSETGIFGFLSFCLLISYPIKYNFKKFHLKMDYISAGLIAGILVYLVISLTHIAVFFHRTLGIPFWVALFLLLVKSKSKNERDETI